MGIGRLVVRTVVGGLFVGHGTQKLFGWFGGPGVQGTEQMMDNIELRPTRQHAMAAGVTETVGGAMIAVGLAIPVAAAGLIGVMTTAIRRVHLPNGVWNPNGGYEYNLVLIAALLHLADDGPGRLSLDRAFGFRNQGALRAIAALTAGVGASALVVEVGRRRQARDTASTAPGGSAGGGESAGEGSVGVVQEPQSVSVREAAAYPDESIGLSNVVPQFGLAP